MNWLPLRNLDWQLGLAILILLGAGLVSLASTSSLLFERQLLWAAIGISASFLVISFDWRPFVNYRGVVLGLYLLVVGLLVLVYFFAPTVRGAQSWLFIGEFQFQPSEFMKVALIILYSLFFSRRHVAIARVPNLIISFLYFLLPAGLIALQPDFGTVMILFAIWLGYLLISGIRWRHLAVVLFLLLILGIFMWQGYLADYQKARILGFLFPGRDPLGINYGVIQSKIAIGSAGLFGKGFGQGTQVQLGFLPERQTDFIFAAFVEEWGLLAGMLVIAAFVAAIFRIIKIGSASPNNFSRFICLGAAILFLSQFILNIGSNLGLTPVVGVTFPFMSYGGSSLLTDFFLLGIIQSIFVRRSL